MSGNNNNDNPNQEWESDEMIDYGSLITNTEQQYQSDPMAVCSDPLPRLRYIRVKDLGNKLTDVEKRNKKIIQVAKPLPADKKLSGRSIYWFVTMAPVTLLCDDTALFECKQSVKTTDPVCYLNQIDFKKNKSGNVWFLFAADNHVEHVICYATNTNEIPMPLVSESPQGTPGNDTNNTNVPQPAPPLQPAEVQHDQFTHPLPVMVPTPTSDVNTNVLLLVPGKFVECVQKALQKLKYEKEASSANLHLFSFQQFVTDKKRHVLVLSYNNLSALTMMDCLSIANDAILLLENSQEQGSPLMTVSSIANVKRIKDNQIVTGTLQCKVKAVSLDTLELDYNQLHSPEKKLLAIDGLEVLLSGVSSGRDPDQVFESCFIEFLDEWSLAPPIRPEPKPKIYLCFRYEPNGTIRAVSEYAAISLKVLGVPVHDVVQARGSALVYMRCPSYTLWYILAHKEEIFKTLTNDGLKEIYECSISDVDASIDRPDNADVVDELNYLKEQMISDGIDEHATPNRFQVAAPPSSTATSAENTADDKPADFMIGKHGNDDPFANVQLTNRTRGPDSEKQTLKLALLIGINKYQYIKGLTGAVNDVELMKTTLINKFGFKEENIMCLISDDNLQTSNLPTRDNILAAFATLIENVKQNPGGVVTIHYSGHGSVRPNPNHPTGQNETIVPCDSGRLKKDGGLIEDDSQVPPSTDITDEEIRAFLSELSKYAAHVSVIFDSCHSESITRDPTKLVRARIVSHDSRLGTTQSIKNIDRLHNYRPSLDNVVVIAACAYNRLAYEVDHEAKSYGALTFYWCTALQSITSVDEQVTYGDIFGQIATKFEKQTPKIEGERTWQLFGTSKLDGSKFAVVIGRDGDDVQLDVGTVHAITRGSVFALYKPNVRVPDGSSQMTASVVFVGSTTCWASLQQNVDYELKGYRAFEIQRADENRIAINLPAFCLESVRTKLSERFREVEKNKAVLIMKEMQQPFNHFINLTKTTAYVVTDKDNNIVLPPDPSSNKEAIVNNLLAYAQYEMHLHNHNETLWQDQIEFVVYHSKSKFTPVQQWTEIRGHGELVEGEYIRFGVRQTSQEKLYFAIIQFDENGGIKQIYPEDHADTGPLPSTEFMVNIPDGTKAYGPVAIDKSIPGRVNKAAYKLYVTTEPTNYRYLEQEGYSATRGVGPNTVNLVDPIEWTSKTIWCTLKHK